MKRFLSCACFLALFCNLLIAADDYVLGIDSQPNLSTPKGKLEKSEWKSNIFPGTVREMAIYVPAQYDGKTPAAVMIFKMAAAMPTRRASFVLPLFLIILFTKKKCL